MVACAGACTAAAHSALTAVRCTGPCAQVMPETIKVSRDVLRGKRPGLVLVKFLAEDTLGWVAGTNIHDFVEEFWVRARQKRHTRLAFCDRSAPAH